MKTLLEILHITPLFLAIFLMICPQVYYLLTAKRIRTVHFEPLLLLLCSIGIAAGANTHAHFQYLLDPCFGYALILVAVAAKMSYRYGKVKV